MATLTSRAEAVERLADVLTNRPAGIFSDFDGTLSAIAPTPAEACIAPGAEEVLRQLVTKFDTVGIVTGRAISDVQAMVGIPELLYVGNHGLEAQIDGVYRAHPAGLAAETSIVSAFEEIDRKLSATVSTEGMVFEHKRLSASIHYRVAPEVNRIETLLAPIAEAAAEAHDLRVTYGKMMIELRPLAPINKGTAIHQIVLDQRLRSAVFFGDDVTDADGFRSLADLARDQGVVTLGVGVLTSDTALSVIETSDILLDGVQSVVDVLSDLAGRVESIAST